MKVVQLTDGDCTSDAWVTRCDRIKLNITENENRIGSLRTMGRGTRVYLVKRFDRNERNVS